ncbi:hypothetical protein B0H63DRAFT_458248 [Podospora didyma]|uniref:gamma-glutamylcyclotransferase n=1 Tax=Podospora didyma TaxID=330526 RepID=A0AAE0P5P6_9PEZI|nr:hypothetical protein B0H63DRAFT_458248 [Podospora didyma]
MALGNAQSVASAKPEPAATATANDSCNCALCILQHLEVLYTPASWLSLRSKPSSPLPRVATPSYPPISSIPRTSPARLALPDASPTPFPSEPVLVGHDDNDNADDTPEKKPSTILYLAYGSNLCAATFLGVRGIRPLSQVNVSAPSLCLVFDLPGIPYKEPCFANTALRKIPSPPGGGPPKLPPGVPDIPNPPPTPEWPPSHLDLDESADSTNNPVWSNGLIGVVYEVTPSDYNKIIATEGGHSSYQEIVVPCLTLPAAIGVPEKPPLPPMPFLARTLFAPRLPDVPDHDSSSSSVSDGDDDDDKHPKIPSWAKRLLLPVRRPDPDYAQPSERYLNLIRDGAKEHDLPAAYQRYLALLQPYTATTWRQRVGSVLFLLVWAPLILLFVFGSRFLVDGRGSVPRWLAGCMTVLFNLVWLSYDLVGKPLFGDGERTQEDDEQDQDEGRIRLDDKDGDRKPARRRRTLSLVGGGWINNKKHESRDEEEQITLMEALRDERL